MVIKVAKDFRLLSFIYIAISILFLGFTILIMKFVFFPVNIKAALRYYKEKKIIKAKKILQKLLEKMPGSSEVHFLLARCYLLENNKEMALVELKEVDKIGLFSEYFHEVEFRETFANLLYSLSLGDEALRQFIFLTQKNPDNPEYFYRAARLFEERKNLKKAIELYNRTITIDSSYEEAFIRLGEIYYNLLKKKEAEAIFTKAYNLNQYNSTASFWLGIIAKDKGDYKNAITYIEPALRNPDYKIKALIERGKCFFLMGNYYGALPELERAVRLAKGANADLYLDAGYTLASVYENNKESEKAIEQWKAIFEINPGYLDVAAKLEQFHQLRNEDRIKDYITATKGAFFNLCRRLLDQLGLHFQNVKEIPGGCEIAAAQKRTGSLVSSSNQTVLVWFLRVSESITESTARSFLDRMKDGGFQRGILCSSTTFTTSASQFASSRPIDLITPSKLKKMLEGQGF
ncbi:MAG: tetratricopeptide repeat protein [Spirochaetales bacterium]|nr:tetratricopeptide repeat protein [Spirochaetales bacterium]